MPATAGHPSDRDPPAAHLEAVEAPAWHRPEGAAQTGEYDVTWNGTNEHGDPVTSGVCFVRVRVGQETLKRKVVLLR
jgi:hypothetical protein